MNVMAMRGDVGCRRNLFTTVVLSVIRCRGENRQTLESGIVHRVRNSCNTIPKSPTITVSLSA